jgi:hypothetical protein
MGDDIQRKIFALLDVLSVEVGATRAGFEALSVETRSLSVEMRSGFADIRDEMRSGFANIREEMRSGFGRVERRLGNLETRVEDGEARADRTDLRLASLESRVD